MTNMDIVSLINTPKHLDKETQYQLRALLALYPYFQPARLLLLRNLYLLHDPTFDQELRKAAIYLTDRRKIFELVEASHYQIKRETANSNPRTKEEKEERTLRLIDEFLGSIPTDDEDEKKEKRKPTPADAAIDYVSYLIETEEMQQEQSPQLRGQSLIDDFINNDNGKIQLKDTPEDELSAAQQNGDNAIDDENAENSLEESYQTETLAKIYVKQGRYSKALEIIKRLNLNNPKKNAYFADQIRYLEKLILNNKTNN